MESQRKIIWAFAASQDLKENFDYIAVDHPAAAQVWVKQIILQIEKLISFPHLGRTIPEIGKSRYREIILGDYRIFHEVREKEILIFRIFHSKRLFT